MFEIVGYFKEFYVNKKFIGSIKCEKDRDDYGYKGRIKEILQVDLICDNRKKIKAGTEVYTYLYPLCGKLIDK